MTSLRFVSDIVSGAHELSSVSSDTGRPVAIQWQNSDHLGSSREGASGSVMTMVYVVLASEWQDSDEEAGEVRARDGASWSFFGLRVLPSCA